MDKLVPGVVRLDQKGASAPAGPLDKGKPPAASPPAASPPAASPPQSPSIEEQRANLMRLAEDLKREREELERAKGQLASELASAAEERVRLGALRASIDADVAAQVESRAQQVLADRDQSERLSTTQVALTDALEERGLIGMDEFERALGGMANARVLRELLTNLSVPDPEALQRKLVQRLRLVGGESFPFLEPFFGMVTVSHERAELDGRLRVRSAVEALGETLLLNGISTVTVVGDRPVIFRCVQEYLDERITFRGASQISAKDVSVGAGYRATIVWGIPIKDSVSAAAETSGHRLYSDSIPRGVVEHCERTRSWLEG